MLHTLIKFNILVLLTISTVAAAVSYTSTVAKNIAPRNINQSFNFDTNKAMAISKAFRGE